MCRAIEMQGKRRNTSSGPSTAVPPSLTLSTLIVAILLPSEAWSNTNTFSQFEEDTTKFNHLVVDHNSGRVYIGAVNWLYQLKPNLEVEVAESTGPYEDSPECPVSRECPSTNKKLADNVNKVLVIDYKKGRLLTCGTLFQGACNVHKLHNISYSETVPNEAVAANDDTSSTVAFIAPGPPNPPTTYVLYVGASYATNGPYREDLPAVSSRSLEPNSTLGLASTFTRIFVNSLNRDRYPIKYVYGFASRGFSYFLTTQKNSTDTSNVYISKLIRICHRDSDYYSYTEIPIQCKSDEGANSIDYNLVQAAYMGKSGSELANDLGITSQENVLYAVFSKSKNSTYEFDKASTNSALCVFSLRAIHHKFTQNIQHCFNGNGDRGLDFISPSTKCSLTRLSIDGDFCGEEINSPLGGQLPVVASPVIRFDDTFLTAVVATPAQDYTAAFLGTSNGHLLKIVVESSKNAFQYGKVELDNGNPINSDILFDLAHEHIYVMTDHKVIRVKVQHCDRHKTCGECLMDKDPYCGWCSVEKKCGLQNECEQASEHPSYWLTYRNSKCTIITNVRPASRIQITSARMLHLSIDNLPESADGYECVFKAFSVSLTTRTTMNSAGLTCYTPLTDDLPPVPPKQHHYTARLAIHERNGSEIAATPFKIYDCSTYTSCTQCVTSPFPCDWCVDGDRCTHDTNENCRNDILITDVNSVSPSIRSGPRFCPRISPVRETSGRILVPNGSSKRITVKVDNVVNFIAETRFLCQFIMDEGVKQVRGQLLGDAVYCDFMEFNYTSNLPITNVKFNVIWDGSKAFDNPDNIHVLVYHCSEVAEDCLLCYTLPEELRCSWCNDSPRCQGPVIRSLNPAKGPVSGGTRVNITGDHMNSISALEVFIGDLPCKVDRMTEHWFECMTSPFPIVQDNELQLKYERFEKTVKNVKFSYVTDPEIILVESTRLVRKKIVRGIRSGGVPIIVRGVHLDIVQDPKLYVIEQGQKHFGPCHVETATLMRCQSPRIPVEMGREVVEELAKPLELGFILDNVNKYRNFTLYLEPPPEYFAFKEANQTKCFKSDYLTINGVYLDRVYSVDDVVVEIGTRRCLVTSLSRSQLTCRPPATQPPAKGNHGLPDEDSTPSVEVIVGGTYRFDIGYLAYANKGACEKEVVQEK